MLSAMRFVWYAIRMRRSYHAAEMAKDEESTYQFLRKARQAGRAALQIQSHLIHKRWRAAMKKNLIVVHDLYQHGVIARIPEEDSGLITSALKIIMAWADMGIPPNVNQVTTAIAMFSIAKIRLGADAEYLDMIYGGERVPEPLRSIMQSFLRGDITQEETVRQLDGCMKKLEKWLPEMLLFSEESPSQ